MKTLFTSIIAIAGIILLIVGACISKSIIGEDASQMRPLLTLIGGIASASLCGVGLAICAISKNMPRQSGVFMISAGCIGILSLVLMIPGDINTIGKIGIALILVMLGWVAVCGAMFTFLNGDMKSGAQTKAEQ